MKSFPLVLLSILILSLAAEARKAAGRHYTKGYYRKDGTYVNGYFSGGGAVTSSGLPGRRTNFGGNTFGVNPSAGSNRSSKEVLVYPSEPSQEPSWVRQQRLERSLTTDSKLLPLTAFSGICSGVFSGDSIQINHGKAQETVYLYGVKAPAKGEPLNIASRVALSKLVLGKVITVYPKVRTQSSVSLAWVFVGKTCANTEQIRQRMTSWNKAESASEAKLGIAQKEAETAKVGIWGGK